LKYMSCWPPLHNWLACGEGSLYHHVSSVGRARFVAAGAIDPNLYTYVRLGKSNSTTKFWSSLIVGLAIIARKILFFLGLVTKSHAPEVENLDVSSLVNGLEIIYFYRETSARYEIAQNILIGRGCSCSHDVMVCHIWQQPITVDD
jgi:hypothetical protein